MESRRLYFLFPTRISLQNSVAGLVITRVCRLECNRATQLEAELDFAQSISSLCADLRGNCRQKPTQHRTSTHSSDLSRAVHRLRLSGVSLSKQAPSALRLRCRGPFALPNR